MSWNNMGMSDSQFGTGGFDGFDAKKAAESSQQLREVESRFQAELDSKVSLSLAHARQAEGEFGYCPDGAVAVCSDGCVTIMAQSFEDSSVLIFQVGEMGIEDVMAFATMAEAQGFLNNLQGFEPVEE